jgi:quercetin dioxygenase-like cupin family protein
MTRIAEVPDGHEILDVFTEDVNEVDGIMFRTVMLPKAGMIAGYHSHDYAHASYIGAGSATLFFDGVFQGEHKAGTSLSIPADTAHSWQALEDNTRIACVHRSDVAEAHAKVI